jgi:hypothetical protein
LQHVVDEDLPCLDVQFQGFELVVGQVVLFAGFVPHALAFVVNCDLDAFFGRALFQEVGVDVHLSVGLGHDEGLFFPVGGDEELDGLLPEPAFLAVVGDDGGDGGGGAFVSEDLFGFVEVVEVAEVDADYVLPGLCILVGLLGLLVRAFGLLGFAVLHEDDFGFDFLHDGCGLFEHFLLQVEYGCFLEVLCFFVELCGFHVLFHVLAYDCDICEEAFVFYLAGDVEAALDVAQFH